MLMQLMLVAQLKTNVEILQKLLMTTIWPCKLILGNQVNIRQHNGNFNQEPLK